MFEKPEQLEQQIERLQKRLNRLRNLPEDTFPIHTLVQFRTSEGKNWIIEKVSEDYWKHLSSHAEKPLHQWIISTEESDLGDFLVYELRLKSSPFYEHFNPV